MKKAFFGKGTLEAVKKMSKKKKIVLISVITALLIAAYIAYAYLVPQHIYIEEYNKKVIIDKHFRSIDLKVSGVNTNVGISPTTKITSLTLLGAKNNVYLCYGEHNPTIDNRGLYTNVHFINCSAPQN